MGIEGGDNLYSFDGAPSLMVDPFGLAGGKANGGAHQPKGLHRPYIRKSTKDDMPPQKKNKNGQYIDPNTKKPIQGTPDLGHVPGHEFWREKEKAEKAGMSQADFNDKMNNPKYYQWEDPSSNRSHKNEKP